MSNEARRRIVVEPPPLKKLAVWCGIATSWVAIVATLAHATTEGRGPHYVGFVLALLVVAPFGASGFWFMRHGSRPTIAVALSTMVGATAFATMVGVFGPSLATNAVSITLGSAVTIGSGIGILAALHQLGERARHSLRFLIVEVIAILAAIWMGRASMAIAAGLGAGAAFWIMYKMATPPSRPLRLYKKEPGT